jgi:hypothetical protein
MAARLPPDLQRRPPALRPQSHVRGSPVGDDKESHPVPLFPACWLLLRSLNVVTKRVSLQSRTTLFSPCFYHHCI